MKLKEAVTTVFTGKNFTQNALAYCWSFFSMFYLFKITFTTIPKDNIRVVDTIVGFLIGTIVSGIIGYYYGSSKSSAEKTELIKNMPPDATQADASTSRIAVLAAAGWKTTADGYELNGKAITNEEIKTMSDIDFAAFIKA